MNTNQGDKNRLGHWQTDSVMDLLVAQCSDLEGLLSLARRETLAAQSEDFSELFVISGERTRLADRLESYQRQIADLRGTLGYGVSICADGSLAAKTSQLVVEIQAQDVQTSALLRASQMKTGEELTRLDHGQRQSVAYLHGARANGLNCDRRG